MSSILYQGRHVEFRVSGPADGPALVFHHGTPGSGAPLRFWERAAHGRGLRLVTFARPGYAGSDRAPGRRVVDVVADTAAVLEMVGIERCLVAGWSGGGPHALACAARLEAAAAVLSVAGFCPFDADGLDWFAGLPEDSVTEFSLAAGGEEQLRPVAEQWREDVRGLTAADLPVGLRPVLAEGEDAALTPEFLEDVALHFREGAGSGADGFVDDELALTRPWGFDLAEITVPTAIWHGRPDRVVPCSHGEWLAARVPGTRVHLLEGEGHFSLPLRQVEQMLGELIEAAV